jgi:ABC-type multidrug transport system ATPase subunit
MTLTTENLGKRFNREWIFRNFSFVFSPGVYAVTGPNGSGKSTLLQVLWGQLPASQGTVQYALDPTPVNAEEVYRHLAIAAPYLELIEEFTLQEILKFHFSFKKIRGASNLEEILDLLELAHARNKLISHFSSGMKQRLKLGLAFFSDVSMIFLDEPTTNLDKQSVTWYWKHFSAAAQKSLVFIGSNLEDEYPPEAVKINLPDYK